MKIRQGQINDVKTILKLLNETPELQGSQEMGSFYSEDYVKSCLKDNKMNLVLVAEQNAKIIGLLIAEIWKEKNYSFFASFVVLPEHRSKGVGTKLYESYENYCKDKKYISSTLM